MYANVAAWMTMYANVAAWSSFHISKHSFQRQRQNSHMGRGRVIFINFPGTCSLLTKPHPFFYYMNKRGGAGFLDLPLLLFHLIALVVQYIICLNSSCHFG